MHRGYIKLWRKIFDTGIQREPITLAVWVWLLGNVTHKPLNYIVRGKLMRLEPGEIVIGRKRIADELSIGERCVRTALDHLESWGNVTIRATKRFSIIKVNNWGVYQQQENSSDHQNVQEATNTRPRGDQEPTTKQECKEHKNVKKKDREGPPALPEWIDKEIWADFQEFRIRIKAPLTNRAITDLVADLQKLKDQGHPPNDVIRQSIKRGWRGVFPLRDSTTTTNTDEQEREAWMRKHGLLPS